VTTARANVYLVGAGPGDPGLITVRGSQLLERAEVVVFDRLVPQEIVALAPPGALRIDVGKRPGTPQSRRQAEINELLVRHGRAGKLVVRLKGGDPFVFGRGGEEAEALADAGVPFEVVPGVSSAFAVPAAAGVPVTHRGVARSVTVVTGHVGGREPVAGVDWEALARVGGTLVVMMGMQKRAEIAQLLIAAGRSPSTPVLVVERGTTPRQRVVRADLASLAEIRLEAPSIIVIGEVAGLELAVHEPPRLEGMTVVVTRAHDQARTLSSALEHAGAQVVALPVIAIADAADGGEGLRRAADAVARGRYDWVVLSSANAAQRLAEALGGRGIGPAQVAVVGAATSEALEAHGLRADLLPPTASAEALADAMPDAQGRAGRVLFVRAAEVREVLAPRLRAKGWEVDEVEAYRTVAAGSEQGVTPEALRAAADADVVTFTSPSTVRCFLELASGLRLPPVVACIGPVTAAAAADAGLEVDVVAGTQSAAGLVEGLATYFATRAVR